jgi:CubicO group peptidase (beta-lactamase class C family)
VKRIPKLLALPAILFTASVALAQTLPPDITAQVDKVFEKWNRTDSPGCALGVYKDGQIVYKHGYGMANLNDDVTITPETVFHVASMSKQFTAASILLLQQQGKLSIDDDVHKYIPELGDFGERITLRQMMHHTSGLRDQWSLLSLAGWRYSQDLITNDDVMSVITREKDLNFKPGERFMYSNTGFTLLGIVVERVSGMSLREFTTKNIFEPLGMTHTHFRDDHEEIIKHDALGYEQGVNGQTFRMSLTNFDTVGATSLHTTVEDLQLWDENFYQPRVGGPSLIEQMLHLDKLNDGELQDYAAGLEIGTYKGLPTVDHDGADAGYRSDLIRFPEQHFSAAVLCNLANTDPISLTRQVADIFLAGQLKAPDTTPAKEPETAPEVKLTAEQMAAVSGTYWNPANGRFRTISVKDGKLIWTEIDGGTVRPLKPVGATDFHIGGVPFDVHVVLETAAIPRHLEVTMRGGKPNRFESVAPFDPTAAEMADFAGAYVSEEIDPVYRIAIHDGKLTLLRLKNKPDALRPAMQDVFVGNIGTLRFTRDGSRHISGFILDSGRVKNFRFTRKTN